MDPRKIQEVFSDKAFVESLLDLETPEEVQLALEEKDVSLTLEDILAIQEKLAKVESGEIAPEELQDKSNEEGELSEDDLEEVSGGILLDVFILSMVAIAVGSDKAKRRRRW